MADLDSFLEIRNEDLESIITRLDADVNAGVSPEDDDFIDTTEGTFYADIRTGFALELERLWDLATKDMIAASMLEFAWGDYLDAHGEAVDVERLDETRATVTIRFTGFEGTVLGTGVEVSTTQRTAEEDAIGFVTTEAGEIPVGGAGYVDLAAESVDPGSLGNVPQAAVNLLMSPINGITAVTNPEAASGGSDVESDEDYRERIKLAWSAARGGGSVADYEAWALDYPGIGFVRVTPLWAGPGSVLVTVTDLQNDPIGPDALEGLQELLDPIEAETTVDGNQTPVGSLTVVSTADFSTEGRILVGDDAGTYTGKTSTTFTGLAGIDSVSDEARVTQSATGRGLAPVGAQVTVRTAENLSVDVEIKLELAEGYTVDGAAGTLAVGPEVEDLVRGYIDKLPPGGERGPGPDTGAGFVVLNRVASLALRVPGVFDVDLASTELNGASADLAVDANQVPVVDTITLTT